MTAQEALNRLDETVIGDLELKVVLSKALEKQIPKKIKRELYWEHCPICDTCIESLFRYNYCGECGQALDWSDT